MNGTSVFMFWFGWYFRWKTKRDAIRSMQLRSRDEILQRKFAWDQKFLAAEKLLASDKNNLAEYTRYKNYLEVLNWILKKRS